MKRYCTTGDIKGFSLSDIIWSEFEIGYEEISYPYLNKIRIKYYLK